MGTFTVTVKVHNPNDASRSDDIDLMVDTGSSYTTPAYQPVTKVGHFYAEREENRTR